MTTVDAMIRRLGAGRHRGRGGDLRLPHARRADADRHAGDDRRASCRSASRRSSAGEYTFSIFSVVGDRADRRRGWWRCVFAPLIGKALLEAAEGERGRAEAGRAAALYRALPATARCALQWLTIARHARGRSSRR
ncbi:MAG: hypothetical protein MZV49_06760 [Rhodopseudomonas palustris]|nr:hypothetical protein [Rhodopseudomonas palustris]